MLIFCLDCRDGNKENFVFCVVLEYCIYTGAHLAWTLWKQNGKKWIVHLQNCCSILLFCYASEEDHNLKLYISRAGIFKDRKCRKWNHIPFLCFLHGFSITGHSLYAFQQWLWPVHKEICHGIQWAKSLVLWVPCGLSSHRKWCSHPDGSSWGNMQPSEFWDSGCVQVFSQCLTAAAV